jgi:DNA-binding MarR family transcriptional regulator
MKNETTSIAQDLMNSLHTFRKVGLLQQTKPTDELSHVEFLVLRGIHFHSSEHSQQDFKGITPSGIGQFMHIASPTVTQHITNLEQKGYVIREADKQDRRVVRINLTEKGIQVMDITKLKFLKVFEGLVVHLGESESNELVSLLKKSADYIRDLQKLDDSKQEKRTENSQENK